MKPGAAIAIYLLFWAITLFAVLPFGVRTTREVRRRAGAGGGGFGSGRSDARASKIVWTTVDRDGVVRAVLRELRCAGWVTLDDIPGWGR